MRAALYARISDDEPNYDKPAVQLVNLRALAEKEGYEVVDEFKDRVSAFANSRGELKDRPDFSKLMAGISKGRYDVVLAVHNDRISRDTGVMAGFKSLCRKHGVALHYKTTGKLNLDNPVERAQSTIMDTVSELEVAIRMAKQSDRFEDEVRNGRPLWGIRPFGYNLDRVTLNEAEAAHIRWAYSVMLSGKPKVYTILRKWNEGGVLTTRGKKWAYASVRQLLLRPRNAGIVMHRDVEQVGVEATWEPLVSREDYEAVKAILTDPVRRTAPGSEARWLLSTIAHCGVCGGVMRSSSGNGEAVYKCASKVNAQGLGERHSTIAARLIDPLAIEAVAAAFIHDASVNGPGEGEADLAPLHAELAKIRGARQKIVNLIIGDHLSEGDAAKQLQELKEREAQMEVEKVEMERANAGAGLWDSLRASLLVPGRIEWDDHAKVKDELTERFGAMPLDEQRGLIKRLLRITVNPGRSIKRVSIEWGTDDEFAAV